MSEHRVVGIIVTGLSAIISMPTLCATGGMPIPVPAAPPIPGTEWAYNLKKGDLIERLSTLKYKTSNLGDYVDVKSPMCTITFYFSKTSPEVVDSVIALNNNIFLKRDAAMACVKSVFGTHFRYRSHK